MKSFNIETQYLSTLKKNTIINDVKYLNKRINENVQNILKL